MKRTVISCDNCGQRMPDGSRPTRINARVRDFCVRCLSLIVDEGFTANDTADEVRRQLRSVKEDLTRATDELAEIRDLAPAAINEYAEGKDPRQTLTKISTHAASMR